MKRILSSLLTVAVIALLMPFSVQAAETMTIDENHSYVQWYIKHLGFSTQSGKWYVKGTLNLDKENPKNSKVDVTIDIDKLVTGIPELDKHLKAKSFFDVEQFPKATFVSNNVDITSPTTAKVTGTLTLHGVSKPVTLNVTLNKEGENPLTNKKTVGFSATTTIKRSEFGINTLTPNLGDEVNLTIEAEAFKG